MKHRTILSCVAAAAMLGAVPASAGAVTIKTGGSTGLQLLAQKLADKFETTHSSITIGRVKGGGSGAGVRNASSGVFDIGTSSRDPASNDPTGLVFTPITKEPFAVIINPKNPIKSLTKDQIKGIFTGAITKWSEVGWAAGGTIAIGSRIGTSGTLATFRMLSNDAMRLLVGAMALAIAIAWYIGPRQTAAKSASMLRGTFWSTLSGFTSFGIHAGGPPIQAYLLSQQLDKSLFQATTVRSAYGVAEAIPVDRVRDLLKK